MHTTAANAANPYAIWVFAFYEIFESAIDFVDELSNPAIGSVEDAVLSAMGDF